METAEAKKQRRATRACDPCRGRKIRCTGVDTGQNKCKSSTMSLDCTFDVPIKRPLPSGQVEELQARIAFLEAQLAGRNLPSQPGQTRHPPDQSEDADDDDSASDSSSSSSRSQAHSSGIAFIPSYIPTSDVDRTCPGGLPGVDDPNPSPADEASVQDAAPRSAYGHLGSSSVIFPLAAARQIPRTYKSIGLQMADQLRKRVRLEHWQWDCSPVEAELDKDPHCFWPSEEEAKELFDAFFEAKGAAGPTMGIDDAVVRKEHAIGPTGGISKVRAARIYAICALGAWHCQLGLEVVNNRPYLAGLHWSLASQRLLLTLGKRYDQLADAIEKAQCYILQASFASTRPMLIQNSWHVAGDAIRVLVDCGMHRKSVLQELTGKADERRRTFWACYTIEKIITMVMGRCSMLSSQLFDAEPPKEDEDPAQWCEIEAMMLTEDIMRAKYAYRGSPPSNKSLRKIETRLENLHRHLNSYRSDSSLRVAVQRLQIMVDSVELLYLAPDILAPGPTPTSALDTLERNLRRTLETDLAICKSHVNAF
ncbi:hypothetical protein BCV69DRAFT_190583 [Microstroma glucosiphilum]|uniref:Zn(2)-C6 fungal-type domain-containing protein n=1 Tax=Pseudomicrostroma glucosiphilum TaxID=1684307 RepID=A0A316UDR5_9BASI|nr:hypothetical protein BCV69DRAFT_190583 [Pseudomicrostroma glucosiphilum]PWN21215.1 hypothetical protein BCV69DRAFT_190583 [Pseudomicrostroma glucosiphilum]